jgi:hypothetical protein
VSAKSPTSRKEREKWGTRRVHIRGIGRLAITHFFVMFIGLLLSWQRPECSRDLRLE